MTGFGYGIITGYQFLIRNNLLVFQNNAFKDILHFYIFIKYLFVNVGNFTIRGLINYVFILTSRLTTHISFTLYAHFSYLTTHPVQPSAYRASISLLTSHTSPLKSHISPLTSHISTLTSLCFTLFHCSP